MDEIHRVGQRGDYLSTDHTYRHMRDTSQPRLVDRQVRSAWEEAGGTDLAHRSLAEAGRLATHYEPLPLDADVRRQMRDVLEAAERNR